jgi:hypothetical protein
MSKTPIYQNAKVVPTLLPAVITTGAVTGSAVQWGDCQSVMAIITAATVADGSHVVELQESDDDSEWTAVAAADLIGTEPTITTSNDAAIHEIGYKGSKKLLRVVITTTAATTGGVIGASFLKAYPYQAPLR